jgi:hypothetical protein
VLVEFAEVVGGSHESPFGAGGGSAAAVESGEAAVVLGVAEDRLDELGALLVELLAELGGEDQAHEVIGAAVPARSRGGGGAATGGIKTGMPSPVISFICSRCQ